MRLRPAYTETYATFSFEDVEAQFQGSFARGINACVECCDRWAEPGRVALNWERQDGSRGEVSFEQLRDRSARFANSLARLGVGPGDIVAVMLPRGPELLTTAMGIWRAGAVYQPLFTAFGPKAIEHRLAFSEAKLVVTDATNRVKLDEISNPPAVLVVGPTRAGDLDFAQALASEKPEFTPILRRGEDLLALMSTSGTTGPPKGVPVPLKALAAFRVYMTVAVDLRPEDRFWNIADPGWAYGLYYAVIGPLLIGSATTFYDGPFTAESTFRLLKARGVTNLAGAPTAFRLLIAAGEGPAAGLKGQLRVVSSAGEPLNPEVIRWFAEHLDAPINDHYGQTEVAMVVNNHHGLAQTVRPGSAGLPMPGFRVVVLDEEGRELGPGQPGVLAIDLARSPLNYFTGYYKQETPAIAGGYYRSGDTVEWEPSGEISFVGRADDVITSAGYRIGPFDVESALIEHPSVMETAVIGKPDPERTEVVKAFVVLKPGSSPSEALAEELRLYVRKRLSAHAYPREIEFVKELPKTPSGKIQRFILRNQEKAKAKPQA